MKGMKRGGLVGLVAGLIFSLALGKSDCTDNHRPADWGDLLAGGIFAALFAIAGAILGPVFIRRRNN